MTKIQRMKSDRATEDRRDVVDKTIRDKRIKNDELTIERRYQADKTMDEHRLINDEITANRREIRDENHQTRSIFLAMLAVMLLALAVGTLFLFV